MPIEKQTDVEQLHLKMTIKLLEECITYLKTKIEIYDLSGLREKKVHKREM